MVRPLRLAFAGALYHITSWGDRQEISMPMMTIATCWDADYQKSVPTAAP